MKSLNLAGLLGCLVASLLLFGCRDSSVDGRPKLYPVTGVVTYQGSPVSGATVTFFPENPESHSASAKTNDDGRYVLQTFEADDGAVPGVHKVSIMKWEIEAFEGNEDEDEANLTPEPPPKALLPPKYSSPTTSSLQVTVEEGDNNTFDFDLK